MEKEKLSFEPYVVSADIGILLKQWAVSNNFTLPSNSFITGIRGEFSAYMSKIFPGFTMVPEDELVKGLSSIVDKTGLYPISLDRVYYQSKENLDISRLIDENGKDRGLGRRRDAETLLSQFRRLKEIGIREAVLVDDVIFSGGLLQRVINLMEKIGINIPVVCSGIAIGEGIDVLGEKGIEVKTIKYYKTVIDEICERDFFPGVPLSGRTVDSEVNVGAPYIMPFGNPGKWASIPESWQVPLSKFCIGQTLKLFEAIEETSGKIVRCSDLGRKVIGLPKDRSRYVDELRRAI